MATQQKNGTAATCVAYSSSPRRHKYTQLSDVAKKCLVIYKLHELQDFWEKLDEELRNFKAKTNEGLQAFLDASPPTSLNLDYMLEALDDRHQALGRLLATLKDKETDLQVCSKTQNGFVTNCRQAGNKDAVQSDVPKFGSMLQNVLMSSSMVRAGQALRSMLPVQQQLKQALVSQRDAVQNDASFGGISSSANNVTEISMSPCEERAEGNGEDVVFLQTQSRTDLMTEIPAEVRSRTCTADMPPQPLHRPTLPEKMDPEPLKISEDLLQIRQGPEPNVQLTHQEHTTPRRVTITEEEFAVQWMDYWYKVSASTCEKSKNQREHSVVSGESQCFDTSSSENQCENNVYSDESQCSDTPSSENQCENNVDSDESQCSDTPSSENQCENNVDSDESQYSDTPSSENQCENDVDSDESQCSDTSSSDNQCDNNVDSDESQYSDTPSSENQCENNVDSDESQCSDTSSSENQCDNNVDSDESQCSDTSSSDNQCDNNVDSDESQCSDTSSSDNQCDNNVDSDESQCSDTPSSENQCENSVVLGESQLLPGEVEEPLPVLKVKKVEPCGTLIYSWMIATKSELWDLGDVLADPRCPSSENGIVGKEMDEQCQNETRLVNASPASPAVKTPSVRAAEVRDHVDIPQFEIRKFEEMEVVVTHISNPGNFYIQHADSTVRQQALVTGWKGSNSFVEQNCIPEFGTYVMGWFPQQQLWCRGQVTQICGVTSGGAGRAANIMVEVKRLDYGDTACLSLWNVKAMTPEMAALPLQALQVSLANVTPVDGRNWSEEAVEWLRHMVDQRTLYARLYPEGPRVMVELFLEKGKIGSMRRGASLSLRLAQHGHAKHSKLKNVGKLPFKRNIPQAFQKRRKPALDKYFISCYTQARK